MSAPDADALAALTRARRRATGLLVVVAVGFLASHALPDGGATPWLQAALEAGLVGGLADWFAVVALFRHPLGLPIPHTAVIPRSKDGLGASLSTFVDDNFMGPEQLEARIAEPEHVTRLGQWLARPANADRVAGELAQLAGVVLESLDREDLVRRATAAARARLAAVPASRLAGAALEQAVAERRHVALVGATIDGLRASIGENRAALRRRLGEQSPSWVPPAVDDLVFDRAEQVATTFLRQLAAEPDHELRRSLDEQLLALTRRMQDEPELVARVDAAARDALDDELLARWVAGALDRLEEALAAAATGPAPARGAVADAIAELGRRLADGGDVAHVRAVTALAGAAPSLADWARREVGSLIERTIAQWDVEDTSRRLERWLGPDLQFVRINGTVVGAAVGVLLHAVARLLS